MAFISEIQTARGGVAGHVEVALAANEAAGYGRLALVTYDAEGWMHRTLPLSAGTARHDEATGWTMVRFDVAPGKGAQEAAALALIDAGSAHKLLSFHALGTEGDLPLQAENGPAEGQMPRLIAVGADGRVRLDAQGRDIGDAPLSSPRLGCLTQGTLIETPDGPRPIESLRAGDLVTTWDNGDQPVRLIHRCTRGGPAYLADRRLWPVRIPKAALGLGLPERDLWVSQAQRLLYSDTSVTLMFGEEAVLVPADALAAGRDRVHVDGSRTGVTYLNLVFDAPEVFFAEGTPVESFRPTAEAMAALDAPLREEVYGLFPQLRDGGTVETAAYMEIESWEFLATVA